MAGDRLTGDRGEGAETSAGTPSAPTGRIRRFATVGNRATVIMALAISLICVMLIFYRTAPAAVRQALPSGLRSLSTPTTRPTASAGTTTTEAPTTGALTSTTTLPVVVERPPTTTAPTTTLPPAAPATTTTTTTTTTAAPSTPATTYAVPAVKTEQQTTWLAYPTNVSAQYPLTVAGGELSVTAHWSGTPNLTLAIACAGTTKAANGPSGLYLSATCGAGPATVTVALLATTPARVSVTLTLAYPEGTS